MFEEVCGCMWMYKLVSVGIGHEDYPYPLVRPQLPGAEVDDLQGEARHPLSLEMVTGSPGLSRTGLSLPISKGKLMVDS